MRLYTIRYKVGLGTSYHWFDNLPEARAFVEGLDPNTYTIYRVVTTTEEVTD